MSTHTYLDAVGVGIEVTTPGEDDGLAVWLTTTDSEVVLEGTLPQLERVLEEALAAARRRSAELDGG